MCARDIIQICDAALELFSRSPKKKSRVCVCEFCCETDATLNAKPKTHYLICTCHGWWTIVSRWKIQRKSGWKKRSAWVFCVFCASDDDDCMLSGCCQSIWPPQCYCCACTIRRLWSRRHHLRHTPPFAGIADAAAATAETPCYNRPSHFLCCNDTTQMTQKVKWKYWTRYQVIAIEQK